MLDCFHDLEELFNKKCIIMVNNCFEKKMKSFDFVFLTKDNYKKEIYTRRAETRNIVIDYYKNAKELVDNEYFLFCINKSIIVVNFVHTMIISFIISYYKNSTICCVSDLIFQYLTKKCSNLQINYSTKNQNVFVTSNISAIEQYLEANDKKINIKLNIIKKCISGYLLLQSYQKASRCRINHKINEKNNQKIKSFTSINKYITLKNFGYGSSTTLLQYDIDNECLCVAKMHYFDKGGFKLFTREKSNYEKLNHPFIPEFYEYIEQNDELILVIEYINGNTLLNFDLSSLKENEIINIIFEILIVIHYIHSLGYIYRDLKPDNIMIDSNKTVVLIDFDRLINCPNENINEEYTMYFAHEYIAPEIEQGKKINNKVDIYSLGCIIQKIFLNKNIESVLKPVNFLKTCKR